jgi:hypothetical protein
LITNFNDLEHPDYPDADSRVPEGAERAALSRLRMAANLSGTAPVREIPTDVRSRVRGWWFGLRVLHRKPRIADAMISIEGEGEGVAGLVRRFMLRSNIDVARFAIVRPNREPSEIAREAQTQKGIWYFLGHEEQRDLLPLAGSVGAFLDRISPSERRNIRRAEIRLGQLDVTHTVSERSGAIPLDRPILQLASRNRPAAVRAGDLAILERLLAPRPATFESVLTTRDGNVVSLCRGFVQGRTAYLVYQMNDPSVAKVSLGLFHNFALIRHLIGAGVRELVYSGESRHFARARIASARDELITVRASVMGLTTATLLAVALRGTRYGDAVGQILRAMWRYWFGLPKVAYDQAVEALTPPGKGWARAVGALVGVAISLGAIGAGVLMREGLGFLSYITAYPALLVSTYFGGAWTGLLTIALGGLGILYYVIPPYDSFALERSTDIWATLIYVASAIPLWSWWARRTKRLGAV